MCALRLKIRVALAFVFAWPWISVGQSISWTPRDDLNNSLPPGIRAYEGTDLALPLKAWYVEADPADTTWQLGAIRSDDGDGIEATSSLAADADAWIAINGGYFGGGQSFSLVAQDGTVIAPNIGAVNRSGTTFYPTRSAFAILEDGAPDVAWIYDVAGTQYAYPEPSPNTIGSAQPQPTASFPAGGAPWPLGTGIGGGPVLVENGQPRITWEAEVFFGSGIGEVSTRNPRTAVGYTAEGKILFVVVDGRQPISIGASLTELADILISLGAVEAINLDGGGSSTMIANGTLVNRPEGGISERQVASALVLQPKQSSPGGQTGRPTYYDTGLGCCYAELGIWFETANPGFYGSTPSRLNETGTGEDKALFVLSLLPTATYEVAAWWVPASNRATDTPFTVFHDGLGTTIRVDQSDPLSANRWNVLGSFDLTDGDSILVTDDATGITSPSYVVTDALRLTPLGSTVVDDAPAPRDRPILLYPNPTSDRIVIQLPDGPVDAWRGQIVDLLGRVVHTFEQDPAGRPQVEIHLPNLSSGAYIVRLASHGRSVERTFIVTE